MATTIWKGHLTFGLVSIPIRLFKAARAERVRFHQLYRNKAASSKPQRADPSPFENASSAKSAFREQPAPAESFTRIRQAAFVPGAPAPQSTPKEAPQPIPRNELERGYEYEKNRYVVVEDEDLKKITPATGTEMQILEFVKFSEIDPVYLETSYYVIPDEAGEKAYGLLFEALRKSGRAALAGVAMHRREHVMALRPGRTGIIGHTLYYSGEVRADQEYRADVSGVAKKELDLALMLAESLAAPFEPNKFKDTFREKVEALIADKIEGRQVAAAPEIRPAAQVVDIMQALQNSLKMARKPPTGEKTPKPKQRRSSAR
jgi:DNA end-binding protein Ku